MKDLQDKVAIVTGASRGIGRAIALELGRRGARVVVNHRASADQAAETVDLIGAAGGAAIPIAADVSRFDRAHALIDGAIEAYGGIDILVNNAGITRDVLLMRMTEADWDAVIDTNLKSVFNCCKAAIRPMLRARKGGRIINISSVAGLVGQVGQVNYAASKAGMIGLTYALAKEVASRQITVNAIAPTITPTTLTSHLSEPMLEGIRELTPLGRLGRPEDVAHAVAFLASDRAAYITGVTLRVDGGLVIGRVPENLVSQSA
jgi:3-oxoacyl-[acyl-carrier protein] reductase